MPKTRKPIGLLLNYLASLRVGGVLGPMGDIFFLPTDEFAVDGWPRAQATTHHGIVDRSHEMVKVCHLCGKENGRPTCRGCLNTMRSRADLQLPIFEDRDQLLAVQAA